MARIGVWEGPDQHSRQAGVAPTSQTSGDTAYGLGTLSYSNIV